MNFQLGHRPMALGVPLFARGVAGRRIPGRPTRPGVRTGLRVQVYRCATVPDSAIKTATGLPPGLAAPSMPQPPSRGRGPVQLSGVYAGTGAQALPPARKFRVPGEVFCLPEVALDTLDSPCIPRYSFLISVPRGRFFYCPGLYFSSHASEQGRPVHRQPPLFYCCPALQITNSPARITGSRLPSSSTPSTSISALPIIQSTWVSDSLPPAAWKVAESMSTPPSTLNL
jgi:hypothetical protein